MIGTGVLCENLYILELSALSFVFVTLFVNTISSTKHLRLNENSSILWHKRMGHISRQRNERLIKDEILLDLHFSDFDTCVDCIKGKLTTKISNAKADRCTKLLGVIHTDICGSFTPNDKGATYTSSCSLMIIPFMVLSSSFMRSLTLWKISKLKLSSNK